MIIEKFKLLRFGMIAISAYYGIRVADTQSLLAMISQLTLLVLLIIIAEKNIKECIYEDTVTLPLLGLGIVVNILLASQLSGNDMFYARCGNGLFKAIGGALVGGGSFYMIGFLGELVFKREALGGGDVKLMAGVGSFIGPIIIWIVPIWYIVGFIFGVICKITLIKVKGSNANIVPTAPIHFISLIVFLLFQHEIFDIFSLIVCLSIIGYSAYVVVSHN